MKLAFIQLGGGLVIGCILGYSVASFRDSDDRYSIQKVDYFRNNFVAIKLDKKTGQTWNCDNNGTWHASTISN